MSMSTKVDRVTEFVERMAGALREEQRKGAEPPLQRRKLRTVLGECRKKGSDAALVKIQARLTEANIHTDPKLTDPGLRRDDWVWFSTGSFPPDLPLFRRERDLQRFVQAVLGTGAFRGLELYKAKGDVSGREFRLPDGRRIDLLCQERSRSGTGALVVIELKREHECGTPEQVMAYIDAVRRLFPSRSVRGIIVSGREDQVASVRLGQIVGYDIQWLCYRVAFDEVARSQ